jgi:hypothetical protein
MISRIRQTSCEKKLASASSAAATMLRTVSPSRPEEEKQYRYSIRIYPACYQYKPAESTPCNNLVWLAKTFALVWLGLQGHNFTAVFVQVIHFSSYSYLAICEITR